MERKEPIFGFEKQMIAFVEKHLNLLFFVSISVLGLIIRYTGRNFVSDDMKLFLIPWFNEISEKGGLHSLKDQVGDYNIFYQTLIAFMTYLKGNCVYYYKILSGVFDYVLAISAGCFACRLKGQRRNEKIFFVVYAIVLLLPTVIFNSSYWGQCDSIYTSFVILTLLYLFQEKYPMAFVFLGMAFVFKFQTIFILPFIICYYFYKKKFSILYLGVSVVAFWLSGIVAFFYGRNIMAPFGIYANQTGTYQQMYLNIPNFWCLVGDDYATLKTFAILLAVALCGMGIYLILHLKINMTIPEKFINIAIWFVWVCILFLPAMHERYAYLLDVLLIIVASVNKKYIIYAVASSIFSLITYGAYLWKNTTVDIWYAIIYLICFFCFTYMLFRKEKNVDSVNSIDESKIC